MLDELAYTIVYVKDIDKETAFYRDVLEMPIERVKEGWIQFKARGAALVLHPKIEPQKAEPNGAAVHITFRVDDLDATYRQLCDRQVRFMAPPAQTGFGKHATLFDPEGNAIDLIEWSKSQEPVVDKTTVVNDILMRSPAAMEVLEEHGIRICGGCIILLNGSVQETADYSGLSPTEASAMVEELNEVGRDTHT